MTLRVEKSGPGPIRGLITVWVPSFDHVFCVNYGLDSSRKVSGEATEDFFNRLDRLCDAVFRYSFGVESQTWERDLDASRTLGMRETRGASYGTGVPISFRNVVNGASLW